MVRAMSGRFSWPLAALPMAIVLLAGGMAMAGAESPPAMTTSSPEYCAHLNGELLKLRNRWALTPVDVRELADEGRRMCDKGYYRAGVARLRRALMLMRNAR